MKCPNCLSTMYNSTEIVDMGNNTQRMDLHCHNKTSCPSNSITFTPHMGVLLHDNDPWVCHNYSLPMQFNDKWFVLKGITQSFRNGDRGTTQLHSVKREEKQTWKPIKGGGAYNTKGLIVDKIIFDMDFIPISTGDDMHLEANKIFTRLVNLVVFL